MTPEVLAEATEAFFTTKESRGGSGLGFSSVLAFAKSSDGFLKIESAPAKELTSACAFRL